MTDSPTSIVEINETWKTVIIIVVLIYNGLLSAAVVMWGDPANSLHTSALAWSFATGAAILAGLGFGSVVPLFLNKK